MHVDAENFIVVNDNGNLLTIEIGGFMVGYSYVHNQYCCDRSQCNPFLLQSVNMLFATTKLGSGTCSCIIGFCIITMTLFFLTAVPLAEITVTVADAMGMTVNRSIPGSEIDTYHLLVGDTITLTCDNVRGDGIIEIFTPASGTMATGDKTFIHMNVTVESFDNGTYNCSVNTPSNLMCGPDTDSVILVLVGELSCKCCSE